MNLSNLLLTLVLLLSGIVTCSGHTGLDEGEQKKQQEAILSVQHNIYI